MQYSVYDFKAFYNGRAGRVVRRTLQERLHEFWPDVKDLRVMGCGYALPYLRMLMEQPAERAFAVIPARHGALHWPYDGRNLVCSAHSNALPIETNSIDRALLIHHLEFSEDLQSDLSEIWRVMKANGRLLVVVPNRAGLWARSDLSPFGQGRPFSMSQVCQVLRESLFVHERSDEALFFPPVERSFILKAAGMWEQTGRKLLPIVAGVHMVEVSKQLYARVGPSSGSKVSARVRGILLPEPATRGTLR